MKKTGNLIFTLLFVVATFSITVYTSCQNPCQGISCVNGGACNNGKCTCPQGFEGTYCETVSDPCREVVCQNGGTCLDGSCNCPVGYTGATCEKEARTDYYKTYGGNGTDTDGDTYTDYKLRFYGDGTDVTKMKMDLVDGNNMLVETLEVSFITNNTYLVIPQTKNGVDFSGSGTISGVKATLVIEVKEPGGSYEYLITFSSMVPL